MLRVGNTNCISVGFKWFKSNEQLAISVSRTFRLGIVSKNSIISYTPRKFYLDFWDHAGSLNLRNSLAVGSLRRGIITKSYTVSDRIWVWIRCCFFSKTHGDLVEGIRRVSRHLMSTFMRRDLFDIYIYVHTYYTYTCTYIYRSSVCIIYIYVHIGIRIYTCVCVCVCVCACMCVFECVDTNWRAHKSLTYKALLWICCLFSRTSLATNSTLQPQTGRSSSRRTWDPRPRPCALPLYYRRVPVSVHRRLWHVPPAQPRWFWRRFFRGVPPRAAQLKVSDFGCGLTRQPKGWRATVWGVSDAPWQLALVP